MMQVKCLSAMVLGTMIAMTSCSNDDDLLADYAEVTQTEAKSAVHPLSGVWYACYNATGTAVSDAGDGKTADYVRAFKGCGNLITATLGKHLTTIGHEAFSGCTTLSSVSFPLQLQSIADEAFRYCVSLVSINIPIGIRKIGKKAFADCSSLSSVCPYQFEYHAEMADDAFEHTPMLHKPTVKK